jgi:ABC-type Mn2+/Zn2+ transport system permease subunit
LSQPHAIGRSDVRRSVRVSRIDINPAAVAFGILFALQALLFLGWGVVLNRLSFAPVATARKVLAGAILAYALSVYPLLGSLTVTRTWRVRPWAHPVLL